MFLCNADALLYGCLLYDLLEIENRKGGKMTFRHGALYIVTPPAQMSFYPPPTFYKDNQPIF